ncbi:T9SS type A sorting domain-containing protein [Rhodohalobacter barkolensis]|nr:T9SS type A sorting domain-containing protein [Rhodohalobacter barkolensis]
MRSLKLFLLLISSIIIIPITTLSQNKDSLEGDFEALQDIYEVTNGHDWTNNSGWETMTPENMGSAYGVTVNNSGRVTELRLFNNNLRNYITDSKNEPVLSEDGRYQLIDGYALKESIGNLKKLEYIDIRLNKLTGDIPLSFWELSNLRVASLGYRQVNVVDLETTKWPYPEKDDYIGNKFTGGIPSSISNMVNLERLFLERNYFYDTTIPSELFSLPKIEFIALNHNGHTGNIDNVGNAKTLKNLQIRGSDPHHSRGDNPINEILTGPLPESLGGLQNLQTVRFGGQGFTGEIPQSWSNLPSLVLLLLGGNPLSGDFPSHINNRNLPKLHTFSIKNTNIKSSIDPEYDSNKFSYYVISQTEVSGSLPDTWKNSSSPGFFNGMKIIEMQDLGLNGEFIDDLSSMYQLRHIFAHGNNFTGSLPSDWPSATSVARIYLSDNDFSGAIPATLGNMTSTTYILFGDNRLNSYEVGAISPVNLDGDGNYVSGMRGIKTFKVENNSLSQSDLDQIILDMWANVQSRLGTEWENWGTNGILDISNQSTGAGPSNTNEVNNAIQKLESAGWSVKFDGDRTPQDNSGDGDTSPTIPTLNSPSNGSTNISLSPEFTWSNERADSYRLRVKIAGSSSYVIDQNVDGTSFTPSVQLQHNTQYQWQVRSIQDGNSSSWSSSRQFTTVLDEENGGGDGSGDDEGKEEPGQIDAPVQISPQNKATNVPNSIRLKWDPVADAEHYIIHVTRENEKGEHEEFFYSDAEGVVITETEYTINRSTLPNRVHSWRVQAVIRDTKGSWSPVWQFTTANTDEASEFRTELGQNYPNPFNPTTQIRFTIAESQQVSLKVYNMAGQLVTNLVDNVDYSAGTHEVNFNASNLASGIYFYRFITGSEIVTRKMTLMK